jgi:hypothetical protein
MTQQLVIQEASTLRTLIREELEKILDQRIPQLAARLNQKEYLTQQDVVELTGWSKRQLAYQRKEGSLPFHKRGRTIWYATKDVYAWIEEGLVPARRGGLAI